MKTQLEVGPFLAPGSKVEVHARLTDEPRLGKPVKSTKVGDDGSVTVDGLEPFAPYWLVGEDEAGNQRAIQFDAEGKLSNDPQTQAGLAEQIQARSEAVWNLRESVGIQSGAGLNQEQLNDADEVPEHNFEKSKVEEPQPRAKYVDVNGPQRTGADIGTAYPKDINEAVPHPSIEMVKDTTLRTGADVGYAYVKDPNEEVPGKKYEDEKGKQRVGADTGTAVPKPKTKSKREQAEVKDSSVSKAKGATVATAGTSKVKGKARAAVKDPVKPKAAKKGR